MEATGMETTGLGEDRYPKSSADGATSGSSNDGGQVTDGRSSAVPVLVRRREDPLDPYDESAIATPEIGSATTSPEREVESMAHNSDDNFKTYVVASDDTELRNILKRGLERERQRRTPEGSNTPNKKQVLRGIVFSRQFSTFDRHNVDAANSQFHGFYVLFWISVALLIIKMATDNWRRTGSLLGSNEIMKYMFRRDVVVMLLSDGLMCALTGASWFTQRLVLMGYLRWDRSGWIIQNLWQTMFIGGVVGITLVRDWPWTHTIFFVLHGIIMLMKQHSYAFYNGYLSTVLRRRNDLQAKLKQLENISPVSSTPSSMGPATSSISTSHLRHRPSAAEYQMRRRLSLSKTRPNELDDIERISAVIESDEPHLNSDQLQTFSRLIQWEIDALDDELRGRADNPSHFYPKNLTFNNHYEYIVLPTVVYELQYPRTEKIDWLYVAEKGSATFGVIFVMIMVSQSFIYPVFLRAVAMKDAGLSTWERLQEFPWLLSDLLFPFMMEYLLAWYVIWEAVLNILAELTCFADRSFYDAWWNSVSWDQFARDWNRPVHNFLLRHVYHSTISSWQVKKHTATLITFFLSACVHELLMWCIFKKLRGYLLILQMSQLPLVQLSRTRWLRGRKTLGNMIFWIGIFTGPSLLCSLYLIL